MGWLNRKKGEMWPNSPCGQDVNVQSALSLPNNMLCALVSIKHLGCQFRIYFYEISELKDTYLINIINQKLVIQDYKIL